MMQQEQRDRVVNFLTTLAQDIQKGSYKNLERLAIITVHDHMEFNGHHGNQDKSSVSVFSPCLNPNWHAVALDLEKAKSSVIDMLYGDSGY